jgi:hypothetical protein
VPVYIENVLPPTSVTVGYPAARLADFEKDAGNVAITINTLHGINRDKLTIVPYDGLSIPVEYNGK